jgi:hypothetical protein
LTRKKGHNERNARPGNKNGAKGPRVGRKDKTTEPPRPQPRPEAKLPRRRQRAKTGGRDFREGQNSHSVEPFQRGPDLIPRGNGTLLLKIVYHDFRKRIYDSPGKLVGTRAGALAFMDRCIDRRQGRPSRVGQAQPEDPGMDSVDLRGECGEFSMPGRIWLCVLGLARHYGWAPGGTLPPEETDEAFPESFDGSYYPGQAQRIQVDDVVALANALEKALPDIPDFGTDSRGPSTAYWVEGDGPVMNILAEVGARNKTGLRDFIAHCREGGEIWIC